MKEKYQMGISYEQAEWIVQQELMDTLEHPEGIPEKTYKALKRALKWYMPHNEYQAWKKEQEA